MTLAALAKLFDVIPGWVYAAVIAGLVLAGGGAVTWFYVAAANARTEAASAKTALAQEREWHAEMQADATRQVWEAQAALTDSYAEQELKDAQAKDTIARLEADLLRKSRAGGGRGLRDPHAAACPRGPAAAPAGAVADGGAANVAEAGGLLSEPLERLLLRTIAEADAINVAYAACREDAVTFRQKVKELQLSPLARPASAGSP